MPEPCELNEALTARLRHLYSPQEIAEWGAILSQVQVMGLKIDDVFPDGMPKPDVLIMKTSVPVAELGQAILQLQHQPALQRIEILPDGIPMRDLWRVQVKVGLK
jgi:hypothetical protein